MDKTEYTRLVKKYYEDIKRVAFAGTRDIYDAEDITQTAFMKLFNTSEMKDLRINIAGTGYLLYPVPH